MRWPFTLCLTALIIIGPRIAAQSLTARFVISPVLSSYISDWERNPSQITIIISNTGQQVDHASVTIELEGRRTGIRVNSPERSIHLRMGANILLMKDVVDFASLRFSGTSGETPTVRRRLPDDEWELCATVILPLLNQSISACESFRLQFAVAPSLLHPAIDATVTTRFPVFQWNAASMKSGVRIVYRLRIVELHAGQTLRQAMDSNPAIYRNDAIPIPTLVYPVSAEPLKSGSRYAWQVQAIDEYGNPLGDNDGKSDVRQFEYIGGAEQ